jgi:CRP/FNR family cyclic AMP-dependent transcriptional regulator
MALFFKTERDWSTRDVAYLLRAHECFSMLTVTESVQVAGYMKPQQVETGTQLFHEGQKTASFMALILEGEATVEMLGAGHGDPVMLKVLAEGDLIGEQGILDNAARSATVTAATDMVLAIMPQAQFDRLTKEAPALGCKMLQSILRTISERLRDSNRRLHMLTQLNRTMNAEIEDKSRPPAPRVAPAAEGPDSLPTLPSIPSVPARPA